MDSKKRELRKALWSVCFHAATERRAARMQPLPLNEALDIIFTCNDHPVERTSWALQKIKNQPSRDLKAQALQAVKQARIAPLADACQASGNAPSFGDVCQAFEAQTPAGRCTFEIGSCTTNVDDTGLVHMKVTSRVHKPIDQCLRMLDPRNWGRCSPYFDPEKTYEIELDAQGLPRRDQQGELLKKASTEFGQPWHGLLRERFDGEGVATENILEIDFAIHRELEQIKDVAMYYSLYSCDYCQLGFLAEPGGLRKNSGSTIAKPYNGDPTVTEVTVIKNVRYKDFTPGNPGRYFDLGDTFNNWASVLLCARADDEAVFNLCCDA